MKKKLLLSEKKTKKFSKEASKESVEHSKAINLVKLNYHPIFGILNWYFLKHKIEINNSDIVSQQILHAEHIRSTKNVKYNYNNI